MSLNVLASPRPSDWHALASCGGLGDAMYPNPGDKAGEHAAQRVCRRCPVQTECRNEALEHGETWGVWGGLSQRHLRAETKRRANRIEVSA